MAKRRKTSSRARRRPPKHLGTGWVVVVQLVSLLLIFGIAILWLEPPLPIRWPAVAIAAIGWCGWATLAIWPSLLAVGRHLAAQIVWGAAAACLALWWCLRTVSQPPNPAVLFPSAAALMIFTQLAAASIRHTPRPVPTWGAAVALGLAVALTLIPSMSPPGNHPADRALHGLLPLAERWMPSPTFVASRVRVQYPPDIDAPTLVVRPHLVFLLPDSLSASTADELQTRLPARCHRTDRHLASEDPLDGEFSLAFSLDAFHRLPFRHSGQVPFVGRTLEAHGYATAAVAIRGLYDESVLRDWGRPAVSGFQQVGPLLEKRFRVRNTRRVALSLFPGSDRALVGLWPSLAPYLGADTVTVITGLSGPNGRTTLIACLPGGWPARMTSHVEVWPLILRALGADTAGWHPPLGPPFLLSSGFPFDGTELTVRHGGTRTVRLCAPGYLCFIPEEPEIHRRLTQFMEFE